VYLFKLAAQEENQKMLVEMGPMRLAAKVPLCNTTISFMVKTTAIE
jgi:hypothetical protein